MSQHVLQLCPPVVNTDEDTDPNTPAGGAAALQHPARQSTRPVGELTPNDAWRSRSGLSAQQVRHALRSTASGEPCC